MACEDQISTQDLINAKDDAVTLGEVATSRAGAVSTGAIIDTSTNRFGETTDTVQGRLDKIGVIYDDPIRPWSASLLVSDVRAHSYDGNIYIPKATLPFTTGATFDINNWSLLQGITEQSIINDLSQAYEPWKSVAEMEADTTILPVGKKVFWQGYYTQSDGGSNWGIVKSGAHTADGGSIFTLADGKYVEANLHGVINIRKWGCDDALSDNSPQWQKAQDYADLVSGANTRIPLGNFTCLSPIDIGEVAGVEGIGYRSRPSWVGTNAFNFTSSGIPSGRSPFKDFWVIGNKAAGTIAFNVDTGDDGASLTIKGLTFKNITCDGFEEGWRLTGAWNTELRKCETVNCYHGANILGRNVHIVFSTCNFVRGATGAGTGTSTGVRQAVSGGLRAEDIQIKNTLLFGFEYGVDIGNTLVFHMEGCDVDFCVFTCARIVIVEGGGSIKSSWLFIVDATNTEAGIDFIGLGTDVETKFLVFDNYIQKETNAGALVGMDGIFVGVNRRGLEIDKNTIVNFHTAGNITSPNVKYTNNKDRGVSTSLTISEYADRCHVNGNEFTAAINRHPNAHIIFGTNDGAMTHEVFTVTLPASLTSITTTWSALGLPDAPANSRFSVSVNNTTTTNLGWIRGRAAQTSVTIDAETAPVGNTEIDVTVTAF